MRQPTPRPHHRTTRRQHGKRAAAVLLTLGLALLLSPLHATTSTASAQNIPTTSTPTPTSSQGWIRFGHFASDNGPVTVRLDDTTISTDATFETVTPYHAVTPGAHTLTVATSNGTETSTTVTVAGGGAVTVSAVQGGSGLVLRWFADDLSPPPAGQAKVRLIDTTISLPEARAQFVATSIDPNALQGATSNPNVVVTDTTTFPQASPYIPIPAGLYRVNILGNTGNGVVSGKNWTVNAGSVVSLVVLHAPTGATLEVLADAAGAAAAPVGGMATGFGGASRLLHPPAPHDTLWIIGGGVLIMVGTAVAWRRTQRPSLHGRTIVGALAAIIVAASVVSLPWPSGHRTPHTLPVGAPAHALVGVPTGGPSTAVDLSAAPTPPSNLTQTPTALAIPAIGLRAPVVQLGENSDGSAQVPTTTTVVGWYTGSPVPGQPGPAVILGHVDSASGPAVFFRLQTLTAGAIITVGEGATTVRFAVQQVSTYTKDNFPTQAVFGAVPDRAIRLVTCGGLFDRATGHYQDNVVVYGTEV